MKSIIFSSLLAIILLASCKSGKVPFTTELQKSYNLSEATLKKVQFYTSEEIILYKVEEEGDASVTGGKLLISNKKDCEKIIILRNTPCLLEKVIDDHKLLVSFEVGDHKFIAFGNTSGGSYSLLAKEWENTTGKLKYANKTYATENGDVYLNVVLKKLNKLKSKERVIGGRKV